MPPPHTSPRTHLDLRKNRTHAPATPRRSRGRQAPRFAPRAFACSLRCATQKRRLAATPRPAEVPLWTARRRARCAKGNAGAPSSLDGAAPSCRPLASRRPACRRSCSAGALVCRKLPAAPALRCPRLAASPCAPSCRPLASLRPARRRAARRPPPSHPLAAPLVLASLVPAARLRRLAPCPLRVPDSVPRHSHPPPARHARSLFTKKLARAPRLSPQTPLRRTLCAFAAPDATQMFHAQQQPDFPGPYAKNIASKEKPSNFQAIYKQFTPHP